MADTTIKKSTSAAVKLTYTASDLAKELGTSDRNLSQNWLPKLVEVFWWKVSDLREGDRFTAWAREEFFNLQAAISPKIPMKSPDSIIMRDDAGKPLMQNNPDRIGIEEYKRQVWQRYNRTPEKRIDAPLAVVPLEVMDADLIDIEESALERVDSLGEFLSLNIDQIRQSGRSLGQEIGATFLEEISTSAEETIKSGLSSLGKALSPRRKKS